MTKNDGSEGEQQNATSHGLYSAGNVYKDTNSFFSAPANFTEQARQLVDELKLIPNVEIPDASQCLAEKVAADLIAAFAAEAAIVVVNSLARDFLEVCKTRGWSLHWTHRGAYLHLESSELIEAIRGKHGDPLKEAGDVLLVLMSITENQGIPFDAVLERARQTANELKSKPHYAGEEYDDGSH